MLQLLVQWCVHRHWLVKKTQTCNLYYREPHGDQTVCNPFCLWLWLLLLLFLLFPVITATIASYLDDVLVRDTSALTLQNTRSLRPNPQVSLSDRITTHLVGR